MSKQKMDKREDNFSQIPMSFILLPPPGSVTVEDKGGKNVLAYDVKLPGQKKYVDATTYYPGFFEETGWRKKEDEGLGWLVRDLIELHKGNSIDFVEFVYKWGPLWTSRNKYQGKEEVWSPLVVPSEPTNLWVTDLFYQEKNWKERLLKWEPAEGIDRYRTLSRRLSAIIDWMRNVEKGEPVSAEDVARMTSSGFLNSSEDSSEDKLKYSDQQFQRKKVLETLNFYMSKNVGRSFKVQLSARKETFETKVKYFTGWGFFSVACMLVTHLIASDNAICMCDSCNKVYERRPPRRMPKKGQYNYCSECSDNKLFWKLHDRDGKRKSAKTEKKDSSKITM